MVTSMASFTCLHANWRQSTGVRVVFHQTYLKQGIKMPNQFPLEEGELVHVGSAGFMAGIV